MKFNVYILILLNDSVVSAIYFYIVCDMRVDHNDKQIDSGMSEVKPLITLNTTIKEPSNGLTLT